MSILSESSISLGPILSLALPNEKKSKGNKYVAITLSVFKKNLQNEE